MEMVVNDLKRGLQWYQISSFSRNVQYYTVRNGLHTCDVL